MISIRWQQTSRTRTSAMPPRRSLARARRVLTLSCLCVLGLAWVAPGAVAEEGIRLNLKEARDLALHNHPRITAAELEALASQQVVSEASSAFFPTVFFNATAAGAGSENTRLAAGGLNNPTVFDRNAEGVTVSQLITDFGRTGHLVQGSRLHSRAQEKNTEATKAELVLQVDTAFYSALKAESVLAVAQQTLDTRKLLLDQVEALAKNKLRSELDVSFAKVQYEEGKLLVARADNDLKAAFETLSNVLGDRGQRTYRLIEDAAPSAPPPDASSLVDTALARRPDLLRLRLERDSAAQLAQAEKASIFPTISAFGAGGVIPVHDSHFEDTYGAAGLNLSLPLFTGGLYSARRSEAALRAEAADARLRDVENTVIHEVRTSSDNVSYALERLGLTQKLLDNANEAFELAQARYKLGSSSIVELSQAQLSKTEAEIANVSAKYDYQIQQSILSYEVGTNQ